MYFGEGVEDENKFYFRNAPTRPLLERTHFYSKVKMVTVVQNLYVANQGCKKDSEVQGRDRDIFKTLQIASL